MDGALEWLFEVVSVIFIFICSCVLVSHLMLVAREPIVQKGTDKTLVSSTGVQELYERELYGYDILLMLINCDPMTPYPRAIKINDGEPVQLNNTFLAYQMQNIKEIYDGNELVLLDERLDNKVTEVRYVYDDPCGFSYIHYIIE